jgi:hypothetical protein
MENNNSNGNNADIELDRFKQILNNKISEKMNQIFPLHSNKRIVFLRIHIL